MKNTIAEKLKIREVFPKVEEINKIVSGLE